MIDAKNLYKNFGEKRALNDVSVKFEKGKTNLIIGRSGSGKTVLLKSLVGLHEIDKGAIYYDERNFTEMSVKERKNIRKEMGMLFQSSALFDSSNVEENVIFPLDMFSNMTHDEKIERANICLKRVNLDNVNKLYPSELSGGMQKRVAIARAIAGNPKYLFCDEPNSGLDPGTSIVIDQLIKEITEEFNITTIINTHDMNSVMEIGDKVIFIFQGDKLWEGTNNDIFHSENQHLNDFIFSSKMAQSIKKHFTK